MAQAILLHDFFEIRGGGERLAIRLVKELGLDLCYGVWLPESYPKAEINGVKQFNLNAYSSLPGWKTLKIARAFQTGTRFLQDYPTVIFSGACAPLAIGNHLGRSQTNLFYCHTPPRFIYDQKDFFLSSIPVWQRPLLQGLIHYLLPRYETAVDHMDLIIANSANTQRRIRHYLHKESVVIYPPCDTEQWQWLGQEGYYLSTARLDPLKRIDIIIEAFKRMPDKTLIVASGGTDNQRLRRLAATAANITFTGWLPEAQLRQLMGRAIATLYIPRDEDFGISPVESMAAGKPVIGVAEGGLLETVVHEETGLLLPSDPTPEFIIDAVNYLTPRLALTMRAACEARACLFSTKTFIESMRALITQASRA